MRDQILNILFLYAVPLPQPLPISKKRNGEGGTPLRLRAHLQGVGLLFIFPSRKGVKFPFPDTIRKGIVPKGMAFARGGLFHRLL